MRIALCKGLPNVLDLKHKKRFMATTKIPSHDVPAAIGLSHWKALNSRSVEADQSLAELLKALGSKIL